MKGGAALGKQISAIAAWSIDNTKRCGLIALLLSVCSRAWIPAASENSFREAYGLRMIQFSTEIDIAAVALLNFNA